MSPLVKQPLSVAFGPVEQRLGEKLLNPGRLLNAYDVDQRNKRGVYEKRTGFAFELAALNQFVPGVGGSSFLYDNAGLLGISDRETILRAKDSVYLAGPVGGGGSLSYRMGASRNISVTESYAAPNCSRPLAVLKPTDDSVAVFYREETGVAANDGYRYRVFDRTSGYEIVPETRLDPGVGHRGLARAVYAGGFVWFIVTASGGSPIYAYKFTNWTSTPTRTTAWAPGSNGGGSNAHCLDVLDVGGSVYVVTRFTSGGGVEQLGVAEFDLATGAVKAAPAPVLTATGNGPFCILRGHNGANGSFYICDPGNFYTISRASLAITATVGSGLVQVGVHHIGVMGYTPDNGATRVLYFARGAASAMSAAAQLDEVVPIGRSVLVGAGPATTRADWSPGGLHFAANPFTVGGRWYAAFMTEDPTRVQRGQYLAELSTSDLAPTFVGRAMYQRGGPSCGAAGPPVGFVTQSTEWLTSNQWAVDVSVSGSAAIYLARGGGLDNYGADLLQVNLDATLGNPTSFLGGDLVALPGAWPAYVSGRASVVEPPIQFPRRVSAAFPPGGTVGIGTYQVQVSFIAFTKDGRTFESAPCPVLAAVNGGGGQHMDLTWTAPRWNNYADIYTAIYVSPAGSTTLRRQALVKADRNVATQTYRISAPPTTTGPTPYWTGGAVMDKLPAPPSTFSFVFQGREFRCGVDDTSVWHSDRVRTENDAPAFNDGLMSFPIPEGTGNTTCGGAVDNNFAAIFKRDGIWIVQGEGPDGTGRGAYVPSRVPGEYGCTAVNSLATTPLGLVFQNHADGGVYLIDRTGTVQFIGAGVWDLRTLTVTGAAHDESKRCVYFTTAGTARVLVWDYGNPTEDQPLGVWYVWRLATAAAGGCTMRGGRLVYAVPLASASVGRTVFYQKTEADGDPWADERPDSSVADVAILPRADVQLNLAGLQGFGRLYRGTLLGQVYGVSTIRLTVTPGLHGGTPEVFPTRVLAAGDLSVDFRPAESKETAHRFTVEEVASASLTRGFTIEGLALEVGLKQGIRRPAARL